MFARLVERLFSRSARRAVPTPPPIPLAPPLSPVKLRSVVTPMRSGTVRPVGAPPPDLGVVKRGLEMELAIRCDELRDFLQTVNVRGDAQQLIDCVAEQRAMVIRQPPVAAQRALGVTRGSNASATEIVRLVEQDPTLTQALLRHANSTYYATGGPPCVALPEAVRRVGTAGVESVVLRSMVEGLLCRPGGRYQAMVDAVWSHMVRCAPLARSLAPAFSVMPEIAYSLGLLHDIGKLVVFDALGNLRSTLRRDPVFPPSLVGSALGVLHEPLGGLAAIEWGLGAVAARGIASHRRASAPDFARPEAELLFIVERLDLAAARNQPEDLPAWWEAGALTTQRPRVEALLASTRRRES